MTHKKPSKLRILCLSPIEPFPIRGGWQTVIYNDIKYLHQRGHEITVLALTYNKDADPHDISDICHASYFYKRKLPKWRQVLANFGQPLPYTIVRHHDERLSARASELICGGAMDVVLIEDVCMARYAQLLKDAAPIPAFLRGHNVSTTVVRRYYESQRNPVLRYLGWRQCVKFARYDSAVLDTVDGVSQISPTDAAEVDRMNPRVKNDVLYSGVDLDDFAFNPPQEREEDLIVHVGSLDPITKLPAMLWFYDNVLPKIRRRRPRARLELAGRTPECSLWHKDPTDVVVHGQVPDVGPFLAKGSVFIAPQFVGSGIRIKILNAMATGNAVVGTRVACEGLPVTHGQNILITDDEQRFADYVCDLLENPERRAELGRCGRAMVEERFGWPIIATELESLLRAAMKRHAEHTGSHCAP